MGFRLHNPKYQRKERAQECQISRHDIKAESPLQMSPPPHIPEKPQYVPAIGGKRRLGEDHEIKPFLDSLVSLDD